GNTEANPGTFQGLGLTENQIDALAAFLKSMTDERVRLQRAPFDHPQIFIPDLPADRKCPACLPGELPAVGRNGINTYGIRARLPTFFDNLQ
ncbi:MAG TPA: hypothetical protein VF104_08135, partial [Burkholderiales bacterium]